MRVLVTGGAGFVGTHLTRRLKDQQHEVLVIDNLFSGKVEHLHDGVQFHKMDLGTVADAELFDVVHAFEPTHVVHLAAIHYIPYCMEHPGETFAANVRSTEVLLRAISGTKARRVVAASTMDVYSSLDRVHDEDDAPAPSNVYGLSKLLSEELLEYAVRVNDSLSAVSLRFSNIYGPNETNPHLIPRVLELLKSDSPEFRMGFLGGSRDFVHVVDVANAITAALFTPTSGHEVFNVGTGRPTIVRDLIELLKVHAGDQRPVIEDTARFRQFDRISLTPRVEKIRARLGWQAEITLQAGIAGLVSQTAAAFA